MKQIPFLKVIKLAGWSGFGDLFHEMVRLLSNLITTRIIGASDFGLFSLGMTVVNMGSILPRFGLPRSITRFVAFYRGRGEVEKVPVVVRQALLISILLGVITVIGIYFLAPIIATTFFKRTELSPVIRGLSPFIPFGISGMILLGTLQGLKQIKKHVFILDVLWPLAQLCLIVFFFLLGLKLDGLVMAVVFAVVIRFIVAFREVNREIPFWKPEGVSLPIHQLLFFSAPLFLTNILHYALNWTDTLMLGYFKESSQVGIYTISWHLSLIVAFPLTAFGTIFNPMAAEYIGRGEISTLQSLLQKVNQWILSVSLPLAILFSFFPHEILSIFGKEFRGGAEVLQILIIGQLVNAVTGPCGNVIVMKGWVWLNLLNDSTMVAINFILNLLWIPRWGMIGAALATSFSLSLVNLLRAVEVRALFNLRSYSLSALKPIIFSLVAVFPAVLLKPYAPFVALLLFLLIYFFLYISFGLDREDRIILHELKGKMKGRSNGDET